jgi:electron transport complex protein RnfG
MNLSTLRDRLAYQPLLLGTVALLAGAALAVAAELTQSHIAAAEARDLQQTLAQVLPAGFADNDLLADVVALPGPDGHEQRKIHLAKKQGAIAGAVFAVKERGYSGDIHLLMAVDASGTVLGVRVLKHTETPGLGDKIEHRKSPWITAFEGKSLTHPTTARWAVKKDGGEFDSFAGATITPRAVIKAVRNGLTYFAAHRQEILGSTP